MPQDKIFYPTGQKFSETFHSKAFLVGQPKLALYKCCYLILAVYTIAFMLFVAELTSIGSQHHYSFTGFNLILSSKNIFNMILFFSNSHTLSMVELIQFKLPDMLVSIISQPCLYIIILMKLVQLFNRITEKFQGIQFLSFCFTSKIYPQIFQVNN